MAAAAARSYLEEAESSPHQNPPPPPLDLLSVQQILDCDTSGSDLGCVGGNPLFAYEYIQGAGGLVLEEEYPYVGGYVEGGEEEEVGPCLLKPPSALPALPALQVQAQAQAQAQPFAASLEGYASLPPSNPRNILRALRKFGPVSAGIRGTGASFLAYRGGVFDEEGELGQGEEGGGGINHAVVIVGYGVEEEGGGGGINYWIVRNSWGRG